MPLDAQIAGMLQAMASSGLPPISESDVPTARAALRGMSLANLDPSTVEQVPSVENATIASSIPVRIYRREPGQSTPTVVYYHGGGFVLGDLDTHDGICRKLSNDVDAVVVSVDYRLAPEHPFPAAVDDAYAALTWVVEHIDDLGGDPDRVVVAGDSAGATLAAVSAQRATAEDIPLAAQLLAYPAADGAGDYPSMAENAEGYFLTKADIDWFFAHYVGDAARDDSGALLTDVRAAPLRAESLAGLPPAIVATAEFDPLRDEGNAYAEALAAAGVHVDHRQFAGLIHGFYGMGAGSAAAAEAADWINSRLADILAA
jgi:acetyl esterase